MGNDTEDVEKCRWEGNVMVVGVRRTHVWLEVLDGQDAGIRVSVPREKANELAEGDVIDATLSTPSLTPPSWTVESFEVVANV